MAIKIELGKQVAADVAKKTVDEVYCAMTSVDLHGVMLRAAMEEAERT
jgi:hypothetical protein